MFFNIPFVALCLLRYIPRRELFAQNESLGLQVSKTKFLILIFKVSVSCKNVNALLYYIEREVRLGNNQTYTSESQKWHILSKKQHRLYEPAILN